jgi:hypothetical protein
MTNNKAKMDKMERDTKLAYEKRKNDATKMECVED